jgi:flagellar protein FliS
MDAKLLYREAAVRGASPVQLVIFLYEQAIEDVRRALAAFTRGDIETRTREINHALKVVGHLQGSLDMERGGEVARNLYRFYSQVRSALLEAHARQSAKLLEQQITLLVTVREAWTEVEQANTSTPLTIPQPANPDFRVSEWNA